MASDSELSESFDSTESMETEGSGDEWGVIETEMTPYQDEPLADVDDGESNHSEEEGDIDGLTPAVLEQRYDGTVSVDSWLVAFFGCLRNCLSQTRKTHAKALYMIDAIFVYILQVPLSTLQHRHINWLS